jgi:hypothetical protein
MTRRGQIITFYSYKGGVGRSAALANVAALFAQRGKRVLAMDFDLEAPGLHRYFLARPQSDEMATTASGGVIDFFYALKSIFTEVIPAPSPEAMLVDPEAERQLRERIRGLFTPGLYTVTRRISDPNRGELDGGTVTLMPAGKFDTGYAERVRKFPWQDFYEGYPEFVELLVDELCAEFDFVLVDSRTGTTDVGNLCTVLLPEKLVLIFTMNEQSLNGAIEVGQQAVQLRKAASDLRPLPIFPLASRVENAENALQRHWLADAQNRFTMVFESCYGINKDLSIYFDKVQIPHRSFYAYGEQVAAVRERTTESLSLAAAFARFARALSCNNAVDAQASLQDVWGADHDTGSIRPLKAPSSNVTAPQFTGDRAASAPPPKVGVGASRRGFKRVSAVAAAGAAVGVLVLWMRAQAPEGSTAIAASSVQSVPPASAPPPELSPLITLEMASAQPLSLRPAPTGGAEPTAVKTTKSQVPESAPAKPPQIPPKLDSPNAGMTAVSLHASSTPIANTRTANGKQVYQFRVWVEAEQPSQIRSVSYYFDHPSFQQKTFTSSVGPSFETGYAGWGCLSKVNVTVHWVTGRTSTINFDQCAAI